MLLLLSSLIACGTPEDTGGDVELGDCDPIAYDRCATPFPSSFYERDDAGSPTGKRVHLGETTIPYTDQAAISYQPSPALWNELDGWSPMGPLIAEIPNLSADNLPGQAAIAASLADGSPLVVLDSASGERMPVWAELDYAGKAKDGERTLYIRPAIPLVNGHHYVVGLRDLVGTDGKAVAASEGFAALRDSKATGNPSIDSRQATFDATFATLEADGWSRSETVLAWDFTVKSADAVGARIQWMREDARSRVGTSGPPYVVDSVVEFTPEENEHTWKRIYGHMSVPLYSEADESGSLLTRDENGMPYYNGETSVPFTVIVPRTAQLDPRPLQLVQYGHGLLGTQDEVEGGYLSEVSDRYGYILFAVDWTGMKEEDVDAITQMLLTDLSHFSMLPERELQGYVEFNAAVWMMKGAMASDDVLKVGDISLVDPTDVVYYGNSQGAILGGAYVATSTDITRATLGVGGMPYSLLLSRSHDFEVFFAFFQSVYDDERDLALWMALMQQIWDPGESGGFARQMNVEPLEGVPAHTILLQDAIGDAQVTTLGAQNMARAYGAVTIDPAVREIYGVESVAAPYSGSAITEYDHGVPPVPDTNTPRVDDFDTHEDTRRAWAAQQQMAMFFEGGEVLNECQGECLCGSGQCDAPAP